MIQSFLLRFSPSSLHGLEKHLCLPSVLQLVARFKFPRGLPTSGPQYQQLQSDFLTLAEPSALRGSWRYSVLANVFSLFLGPPVESPQAVPLARHCLGLLKGDVLLLRQLGGAGLWLQMAAIVEHGRQNLGVVQEVEKVRGLGLHHTVLMTSMHPINLAVLAALASYREGMAEGMLWTSPFVYDYLWGI